MTPSVSAAGLDAAALRREILGCGYRFRTPFGDRLMLYADYTASGRGLRFLERYLMRIQESYANTHTEDDVTGRSTTRMLHRAEAIIKRAVNGDGNTCIVAVGTGATGAIKRLQEILGVYLPPATRDRLAAEGEAFCRAIGAEAGGRFTGFLEARRPVVFVGPYEHHSNEVSWRESLAEVVEIEPGPDGVLDLEDLKRRVSDPAYRDRLKIGSFSAASNVTGIRSPVHEIARILHRHGALACFDFAASAPYVPIDMNRDPESCFDAVFFSPHKFLGGPGSSGLLLFHRRIYRDDLPPTFSAGGTVDYVGFTGQEYIRDVEEREKPGTPGTLQVLKAALALEVKEAIGTDAIEAAERRHLSRALERLGSHPGIELLGNPDPDIRIAILSFNVRSGDRYLHPKFVTRLLNDLFGIQSRAGCSCAGPYGHRLLHIGEELSNRYRDVIRTGCQGIKPGWVRLCFHYVMDDEDVEFLCRAVRFIADRGACFLPLYRFDPMSGAWSHVEEPPDPPCDFGLEKALAWGEDPVEAPPAVDAPAEYARYLAEAESAAAALGPGAAAPRRELAGVPPDLVYFDVHHLAGLEGDAAID